MKLIIMRHGHAESEADADNLRKLSPTGELEAHKMLQQSYDDICDVEHVFFSPFVRTRETAAITSQYLSVPSEPCDLLIPSGRLDEVIDFLVGASDAYQAIMIVSHQPLVGSLVNELGGFESGRYRMGTAAMALFDCEIVAASCCDLRWLKHP